MEIGERVAQLETKIDTALAGVANFKLFQTEARDFFSRYDERETAKEKNDTRQTARLNLIAAVGTLVLTALLVIIGYLAYLDTHHEAHSLMQDLSASQYQYTLAEGTTK